MRKYRAEQIACLVPDGDHPGAYDVVVSQATIRKLVDMVMGRVLLYVLVVTATWALAHTYW